MENQDRIRLKTFMRWQLLPFIFIVLVCAVFENWCIFYKPGGQILKPYFCVFIYNILLIGSFVLLSYKKTIVRDFLNMSLTYFFLFAVEIFNTARLTKSILSIKLSPAGVGMAIEYEIGDPEYRLCIFIVGWPIFLYAVQMRSKLLEMHRINHEESKTMNENIMLKSEVRNVFIIFAVMLVAKTGLEICWIYYKIEEFKCLQTLYVVIFNILLLISTTLFYRFRNIVCNVINMVIAYSSLIVLQQVNLALGVKFIDYPKEIGYMSVAELDNCVLFIFGGLFFIWTIGIRTMLLADCGYTASALRLVDYLMLKLASAKQQPRLVAVDKTKDCEQGLRAIPPKYDEL